MLRELVGQLGSKHALEREIGHMHQLKDLAGAHDRRVWPFCRSARGASQAQENPITFLEIALLEPGVEQPRLGGAVRTVGGTGTGFQLSPALALSTPEVR